MEMLGNLDWQPQIHDHFISRSGYRSGYEIKADAGADAYFERMRPLQSAPRIFRVDASAPASASEHFL
jgi:hypothetical protein